MKPKTAFNLYGLQLKIFVLKAMNQHRESKKNSELNDILSAVIYIAGARGKINKEQRTRLRQRIWVFLENSVKDGTIKRELTERGQARPVILYSLTEQTQF